VTAPATTGDATLVPDNDLQPPLYHHKQSYFLKRNLCMSKLIYIHLYFAKRQHKKKNKQRKKKINSQSANNFEITGLIDIPLKSSVRKART